MKKIFNCLLTFFTVLLITISCSKTVLGPTTVVVLGHGGIPVYTGVAPQNQSGEYGIVFGNYSPYTKAASENGVLVGPLQCGYDNFNMYAWKDGSPVMNPYSVNWYNESWTYDNVVGQEMKYFDRNSTKYDFIGVISNANEVSEVGKVTVSNVPAFLDNSKELDTPDELLWTSATVAKNNYSSPVPLTFKHANAKLYIGFASDRNDTEVIDYTPSTPEVPATPDTETYTNKTVKFIDELAAGNEVQVGIGFYGANSPKLTKTNPNPLYVGADNTANGYLAKTWLLSIMDAVNAQFVYYRLNAVANSTSKTETTEDWESAASNKNIFMMKLADGVDKAAFAAGNDAFATSLKAHQTDWVGGSPAESFWAMFEQAYADGWRVIRINVNDTNANQVLVFLSSNIEASTQVCTITPGQPATPGTPATPAVPGTDTIKGIRVFTADYGTGATPYEHVAHTLVADASISPDGLVYSNRITSDTVVTFTLPDSILTNTVTWSPTTFYSIPGDENLNYIVVKLSYIYNGVASYDVRVPIQLPAGGLVAGKYYEYELHIKSVGNGTNDPAEAEADKDDIEVKTNPVISVDVNVTDYETGASQKITI